MSGMTIERLKELHESRPFKPFIIHMGDGRSVPVVHPEFLARSVSGRTVVVIDPDDHAHHIDLLLVTDLEIGNGKRGRRSR